MKFGRKILEGYLALAIGILTVVSFVILAGVGTNMRTEFIFLDLLIIILIAVNILIAIIDLRVLDSFGENGQEGDEDE